MSSSVRRDRGQYPLIRMKTALVPLGRVGCALVIPAADRNACVRLVGGRIWWLTSAQIRRRPTVPGPPLSLRAFVALIDKSLSINRPAADRSRPSACAPGVRRFDRQIVVDQSACGRPLLTPTPENPFGPWGHPVQRALRCRRWECRARRPSGLFVSDTVARSRTRPAVKVEPSVSRSDVSG